MIPNPIHKVLLTLSSHAVKHLLMGGQACVFYGAAEFSRDCDIVIVADEQNLAKLTAALAELQAHCIAVPPLNWAYLDRGHAIHFRSKHPDAMNIRLDVMTKMRGCDDFAALWDRRLTLEDSDGTIYQLLGIEDLVKAKKTQRDKDWPMIRRLVDGHYDEFCAEPTHDRVRFWLRESRTPKVLIAVAEKYPELLNETQSIRQLLIGILTTDETTIQEALDLEQAAEKRIDDAYWRPLKRELEAMRWEKRENDRSDSSD